MPAAVELRGVHKAYGDFVAIHDLTLDIHAGEVAVLLGPNGAGKTTALSMMTGLRQPTRGEIRIFGADPRSAAARCRTGVMLQESGIPGALTVAELIDLFRNLYAHPVSRERAIDMAGLQEKSTARAQSLSGGQRQRLYFALAACGDPDLMFLDEPTVAMDTDSRNDFLRQIRALAGEHGKAVVVTTHYLAEAQQVADRIIIIQRGTLVMDGTPAEVMAVTPSKTVTFATPRDVRPDGLPEAEHMKIDRGPEGEYLVTFQSSNPEAALARLFADGIPIRHLEVVGADLETAVSALLHSPQNTRSAVSGTPQAGAQARDSQRKRSERRGASVRLDHETPTAEVPR